MSQRRILATEDQYEDTIVAAAMAAGWLVHVERRSRTKDGWKTAIKGHAGWPDCVFARDGEVIVRELKRPDNYASAAQIVWMAALRDAGIDADILVVPDQLDAFLERLTQPRRKPTP